MLFKSARDDRPYELGPFPMEELEREPSIAILEAARPPLEPVTAPASPVGAFARAIRRYDDLFSGFVNGEPAKAKAPLPEDASRRTIDIKGAAYFLDAAGVGICSIPETAWLVGADRPEHAQAVVIAVEHGREPEPENLARGWIGDAVQATGDMRAGEVAICVAGHIRLMGYSARAHTTTVSALDRERLGVIAGLTVRGGDDRPRHPFLGERFSIAVVSTDYELAEDQPIAPKGPAIGPLHYWFGVNGAESGRERQRRASRASHLSRYPMEQVRRIERPTTLILDDEVPRVPKRAAFFERGLRGDLGEKSLRERMRFALKHPFSMAMAPLIRNMVPLQDDDVADQKTEGLDDPAANARAIKSLSYFLGADLTGICEIPCYAWFSHHGDGAEITPYHRYAVVMLIDQGYETMEGASGDDWISGAQSMRGYMRGAEIAGIMADTVRDLGHSARPQTNLDSDVLQIPLVLWAGLGELSRIGELVLNPFVGPRFKSVVLTTDLPLEVDKPIDFGLQYFCNNCLKCARECPCDAIPVGDKVMFNGYEMWKPDVERCTRYRLTNSKGSACGRCMKTCPLNKVVDRDGPLATRLASWMGVNAMWAKPALVPVAVKLDDMLGNGMRNPLKKWWFDHEIVDGVSVAPRGTNERDIDPKREAKLDPAKQKIAYYHADNMPPPDHIQPWPVDRKQALAAADKLESPAAAKARQSAGGGQPKHYRATPATDGDGDRS